MNVSRSRRPQSGRFRPNRIKLVLAGLLSAVLLPATALASTWNIGDVFAAVGSGNYNVYDNSGVFKETISQGPGGFTTGCSFNPALSHLYTTNFSTNTVYRFQDPHPHLIDQILPTPGPGGNGLDFSNESIVFAANGEFLVGHADGAADVHRYDSSGLLLTEYDVATEARGSDWIDLAANQTTLFYTSEGRRVLRYDLASSTQLADFALLPGFGNAFALRLLPPGDGTGGLLVADGSNVKRLDGSGNVVQTYDTLIENNWFALNLDPNGTSFWSGSYDTNNFYRFNIASGAIEVGPIASGGSLFGLCLKGEPTAAVGPGPPANLVLSPKTDTNRAGEEHCVTATVTDADGMPTPDITVQFSVTGANSASGSAVTDANGQATFCYTGTVAGTDTIAAYADTNNNGVQDRGEPGDTATKIYIAGPPATLVLTPATDTNTVDDQHCVTATVTDANGNPTPNITVHFSVTGSVTTSGSAVTDANGQAQFCYTGPALPGADVITAYADTNNNGVQDRGEPSDTATKQWVLPGSTEGCKVTYGGRITAANGDKATFGGNAQADGLTGQEEYQDHGPAADMNVHSINVQAVVCNKNRTTASIFGQATIDGSGTYNYRIDLQDLGEPGTSDTYRIRLSNGYDSGVKVLNQGNVQIHK